MNPGSDVRLQTRRGYPKLGATPDDSGVNFAIFSRNGRRVILELYQNHYDEKPSHRCVLDPIRNRTGAIFPNKKFKTLSKISLKD
jgi:glycogen operon protein